VGKIKLAKLAKFLKLRKFLNVVTNLSDEYNEPVIARNSAGKRVAWRSNRLACINIATGLLRCTALPATRSQWHGFILSQSPGF